VTSRAAFNDTHCIPMIVSLLHTHVVSGWCVSVWELPHVTPPKLDRFRFNCHLARERHILFDVADAVCGTFFWE
jgi:hypothetical protein